MFLLNQKTADQLGSSSMIRKMFETGIELKKKYGADNVYDFSLGNPDLPPPPAVAAGLADIAAKATEPFAFGYVPNAGAPAVREELAKFLAAEQGHPLTAQHCMLCCGAAGAINALFRAVLEEGDEVLVPAPYFVEYGFYAGNFGGILRPVPTLEPDFSLDLQAFADAIGPKTRAIIINSPNNPTGKIYAREELAQLGKLVETAVAKYGRAIYVVADEPYRALNYDGREIPSLMDFFKYAVIAGSFSKTLSLAGERVGYLAVNPAIEDVDTLVGALTIANRVLGFVNAPIVGQKLVLSALGEQVELDIYRRRREAMRKVLADAGLEFYVPEGAFYFFPKSPVADDSKFVEALVKERVLAVSGAGFGMPGYVRFSFCVPEEVIHNAAPGIAAAVAACRKD